LSKKINKYNIPYSRSTKDLNWVHLQIHESKNPFMFIADITLKDYLAMARCDETSELDTLHCSSSSLGDELQIENPFGNILHPLGYLRIQTWSNSSIFNYLINTYFKEVNFMDA
jgi:hypothetical protein